MTNKITLLYRLNLLPVCTTSSEFKSPDFENEKCTKGNYLKEVLQLIKESSNECPIISNDLTGV